MVKCSSLISLSCLAMIFLTVDSTAQTPPAEKTASPSVPTIREYSPRSSLRANRTRLTHASFPVIDIHTHFGFRFKGDAEARDAFVATMDQHHIALCVSLDSRLGQEQDHLKYLAPAADRFASFVHIDFQGTGSKTDPATWRCNQPGFVRSTLEQMDAAKDRGIVGMKFFKSFGLTLKQADGSLYAIDDPKWDPIWQKCGQLGWPVIMHTADPAPFFDPIGPENERYEELLRHPDWSFHGDTFPDREALFAARSRVIQRHPETTFIAAHLGSSAHDLAMVSGWLDAMPNMVVEIASRIGELGRQPYSARRFIMKYQDRVLFGTDGPWPELRLTYYWRFLETDDEYFPYSEKTPPPQGLWNIYGIHLPDEVLRKVYFENALRIMPALQEKYDAAEKRLRSSNSH